MQLTPETIALYKAKAPELMDAVTSGEAQFIMKRDPDTDYCVKFDAGWCGVQKQYGENFLGDACHFFPRATRALHDEAVMTVAPSCPQAARLMLTMDAPFARSIRDDARVPFSIKHYGVDGLGQAQMLALHDIFIGYVDTQTHAATIMASIAHVAARLEHQPAAQWPGAAEFYLKQATQSLAAPEPHMADALYVLNALQGLVKAAGAMRRPRLIAVIDDMARALDVTLDWEGVQANASPATAERIADMQAAWHGHYAHVLDGALKRYIQMQLSLHFFPFAGLGETIAQRAHIIAIRVATVQQALMSFCMLHEEAPGENDQVRIIQSLSRFMDHLSEPALSLAIYHEVGWHRESRLNGLLGLASRML